MNRREALLLGGSLAVSGSVNIAGVNAADGDARLLELARQWDEIYALTRQAHDDDEIDRLVDSMRPIEEEVARTPAQTVKGLDAKWRVTWDTNDPPPNSEYLSDHLLMSFHDDWRRFVTSSAT